MFALTSSVLRDYIVKSFIYDQYGIYYIVTALTGKQVY